MGDVQYFVEYGWIFVGDGCMADDDEWPFSVFHGLFLCVQMENDGKNDKNFEKFRKNDGMAPISRCCAAETRV